MKDAYFFPHDSNARNDEKMLACRAVYGMEGIGIFWCIVEMLRDASGYKLVRNKYTFQTIATQLNIEHQKAETFINDCVNEFTNSEGVGLLCMDEKYLWSESLLRRMEVIDEKRAKARESANIRWQKGRETNVNIPQSDINANAMRTHSDGNASKVKDSKVKDSKKKDVKASPVKQKFGQFLNVFLTTEEYEKLKERFNSTAEEKIEELSEALKSKAGYDRKYTDHYATILSWARMKEKNNPKKDDGQWHVR